MARGKASWAGGRVSIVRTDPAKRPRDRHQPALARMLVLAVAAARPVEIPTIFFDEFYGFSDFHPRDAIVRLGVVNSSGERRHRVI